MELKKGRPKKENKLNLALVIAELKGGKTAKQIAKTYGYTPEAIHAICRRHGFSVVNLRAYQERKADLLAFKQSQILESMGPEKINEASLRDQATAFNILHNAERLARGQSTENVSFAALTAELADVEAQIEKLESANETDKTP